MSGATAILVKLGVRLIVFTAVFWIAAKRNPNIVFAKRWAPPVVGLVFAILNTGLYWMLRPVLDLATMGAVGFALPMVINGVFTMLWMALFLTVAHGVLWLCLDYLPGK